MKLLLLLLLFPLFLFPSSFDQATSLIKQHEGFVATPYVDQHHFSVGYGTNLMTGITKAEATLLLTHRLAIIEQQLNQYNWYRKQNQTRQAILLDMGYNLGIHGLLQFKSMIWALNRNYYNGAANALKHSLWYKQTKSRGKHLVKLMRQGHN